MEKNMSDLVVNLECLAREIWKVCAVFYTLDLCECIFSSVRETK
jgi:hypothetical protein